MNRCLVPVCLVFSLAAGSAYAAEDARGSLIRQGIEAYSVAQSLSGHDARAAAFARAERLFTEAARDGGANADLHANAGTAALRAERLGPAVLAFKRALAVDPDHARARRNLAHARTLLPAWVPKPSGGSILDTFFFWHRSLSAPERLGAAGVCFVLAALAFAAAIRWRSRLVRGLAWLPAAAWVGLVASVAVEARGGADRQAVITADEAVARASDSANAPARFAEPLPGGTEVEVMEARERWVRIRLANDREAWISRGSLEMINEKEI